MWYTVMFQRIRILCCTVLIAQLIPLPSKPSEAVSHVAVAAHWDRIEAA
jgi:hypothetical protein